MSFANKRQAAIDRVSAAIAPNWIGDGRRQVAEELVDAIIELFAKPKKAHPAGSPAENMSARSGFTKVDEVFASRGVKQKHWDAWLLAYPDGEWIMAEVGKAVAWEISNNQRKANFPRFMANWLARGWDKRTPGSRPPAGSSGLDRSHWR